MEDRGTYPLLAHGFRIAGSTRNPFGSVAQGRAVASNLKLGAASIVLEVKRIELFSDAF